MDEELKEDFNNHMDGLESTIEELYIALEVFSSKKIGKHTKDLQLIRKRLEAVTKITKNVGYWRIK